MATTASTAHVLPPHTQYTLVPVIQYVVLYVMDQKPVTVMNVATIRTRMPTDTVIASMGTMETIVT